MSGVSTSEAVVYGIKHMIYMGVVYAIGFGMMIFGIITAQDSNTLGIFLLLIGLIILLGGLHGAIYKMAGDATARVMTRSARTTQNRSTPTAEKVPADEESVDEKDESTSTDSRPGE